MKDWLNIELLLEVIRSTPDDAYALRFKSDLMDAIDPTTKKGQEIISKLQMVLQERNRVMECKKREEEDRADERERFRLQGTAPQMYVNSKVDYGTGNIHQLHS